MVYDVVIVGGGPAGLSAALALGRSRRSVLLCDAGPRRNAAAERIQNFVTRDGTPPEEFRRIGHEELSAYPSVEIRPERVGSIEGSRGAFVVQLEAGRVEARRILLCTGMVDEMLPLEGFRELWGRSIFQCPYCHGWEARDQRWAFLPVGAAAAHLLPFALQAKTWSPEVTVFTNGAFEVAKEVRDGLERAGLRLVTEPLKRLVMGGHRLEAIELVGGERVPCEVLFTQPPQRQVELIEALDLPLDEDGYVRIDPMRRETLLPGIYAAGDSTPKMQAAVLGAAAGLQAAAMINVDLAMDLIS